MKRLSLLFTVLTIGSLLLHPTSSITSPQVQHDPSHHSIASKVVPNLPYIPEPRAIQVALPYIPEPQVIQVALPYIPEPRVIQA
jgi:hypothetical protein